MPDIEISGIRQRLCLSLPAGKISDGVRIRAGGPAFLKRGTLVFSSLTTLEGHPPDFFTRSRPRFTEACTLRYSDLTSSGPLQSAQTRPALLAALPRSPRRLRRDRAGWRSLPGFRPLARK